MRLTELKRILKAISHENAVLWAKAGCREFTLYGKIGSTWHYQAPVDDVFDLLEANLIDRYGVITDLGRAALAQSVEKS